MHNKRRIAVFDFDGTITTKDTLLEFILFCFGRWRFLLGFLLSSPWIVLMKLHLYPNWKCKERVMKWFFKGMKQERFAALGNHFSKKAKELIRMDTMEYLLKHKADGDTIYVITASVEEWVKPICESIGVSQVLATKMEVDKDGALTGRFSTANCYGAEKVRRLMEVEPDRENYYLCAYGDSRGDKELLEFADKGLLIR